MRKKLTHDELLERVRISTDGKLEIIGETNGSAVKAETRCNVCGYTWWIIPSSIYNEGKGCPKCKGVAKLSREEISTEIDRASNGSIELISDTNGVTHKATVRCKVCGHTWDVVPCSITDSGSGCPKCSQHRGRKKKWTVDEIIQDIYTVSNYNVDILGEVVNRGTKVTLRCRTCGYVWDVSPLAFSNYRKGRCPSCSGKVKYTREDIDRKITESSNGSIKLIGETNGSSAKTTVECMVCGYIWDSKPIDLWRGHGCPHCNGGARFSEEYVDGLIKKASRGRIELIGNYKSTQERATMRCNVCGHIWDTVPTKITFDGKGCPICKSSKGEERIFNWFMDNWIQGDFIPQYKIDNLRGVGNGRLPFDFYVPSKNLCIEYQGVQHYEAVDHFGGDDELKYVQEHDQRKRQYCIDNGIDLLEISYTDKDRVEEILNEKLLGIH